MKRLRIPIIAGSALIIGCVVGYVVGSGRSGRSFREHLLDANATYLADHVNYLALMRTGQLDDCAARMEETLDNSILQAAYTGDSNPGSIPPQRLAALKLARVYMDATNPTSLSEESRRILRQVGLPEAEYCSPALRELQAQTNGVRPGT